MHCTYTKESGEPCGATAEKRFTWAWGAKGLACGEHVPPLVSLSHQLNREITFEPLEPEDATDIASIGAVEEPTAEDVLRAELFEARHELTAALARIDELTKDNESLSQRNATAIETLDALRTERDTLRMGQRERAVHLGERLLDGIRAQVESGEIIVHNFSFEPFADAQRTAADAEAARLVLVERVKDLEHRLRELEPEQGASVVEGPASNGL